MTTAQEKEMNQMEAKCNAKWLEHYGVDLTAATEAEAFKS